MRNFMITRLTSYYNPTQFVAVESQQCVQQSQAMLTSASHVFDASISNCLSGAQTKYRLPDSSLPTRKSLCKAVNVATSVGMVPSSAQSPKLAQVF